MVGLNELLLFLFLFSFLMFWHFCLFYLIVTDDGSKGRQLESNRPFHYQRTLKELYLMGTNVAH